MPRVNLTFAGFKIAYPDQAPEPVSCFLASGYAADIYVGDAVTALADGSVQKVAANSGAIYGYVTQLVGFRDSRGVYVRNGRYIPSGTTWTAHSERSQIMVVPAFPRTLVLAQGDDATVTTFAIARSLRGENVDIIYGTPDQALGLPAGLLDMSTHAVTATLQMRIEDVLDGPWNDPTVTRCTFVCYANLISNFGGLPAVLGV